MHEQLLKKLYQDVGSPGGLRSVNLLYQEGKKHEPTLTIDEVKEYLKSEDAYTLHRLTRKRFPRRRILVSKPRYNMSADLMDVTQLRRFNDKVGYILVILDSFSRYLRLVPQQNKTGKATLASIKCVLEDPLFVGVKQLYTDKGTEFYNTLVKQYLKDANITLYSTQQSAIKAAIAERAIRTIRGLIYKYLTAHNTKRYIDALADIERGYNRSPHRGLGGKTPSEVHQLHRPQEVREQFKKMYITGRTSKWGDSSAPFTVGDTVRLATNERTKVFTKAALPRNSLEIFKITRVDESHYPPVYFLKDLADEPVQGLFYREELVGVTLPEYFPVDVIKKKTLPDGKERYLVHYRGYSSRFDSWISPEDLSG